MSVLLTLAFFVSEFAQASWAEQTLAQLTLREKIGQFFIVATVEDQSKINECGYFQEYHVNREYIEFLIEHYAIGGLIYLGSSDPVNQLNLTNHYQELSEFPLLICMDCEWGLNMRMPKIPAFPRQMTLGALQDQTLIYLMGQEIARQCKLLGIHVNFAPVVDLNNNPLNPVINNRSFGQDKESATNAAIEYMRGMQSGGIIACAKHFPGHGDTKVDSHVNLPVINHSLGHLFNYELYPFMHMIKNNIDSIMIAHLLVPAIDPMMPSSLSKSTIEFLRKQLNFTGLVFTDGLGMGALINYFEPGSIELHAFLAGNDLILCPVDVPRAIEFIEDAVKTSMISQEELDTRVLRILRAKEKLGLHKDRIINPSSAMEELLMPGTFSLKKKLYQEAITLVKNENNLLPLAKNQKIFYAQINGNDQNKFEETLKENLIIESISIDKISQFKDSIVIVSIFEMNKFATQQFGISNETLQLINELKKQNNKIVLTIFGSPYSLSLFDTQDSILMCYEDDVDAQEASAHIICGKLLPKGKLPVDTSSHFKIGTGLSF